MPLWKTSSPRAFKHNIRTEYHAGKPIKQAVAIAYSTQRRAKAANRSGIAGTTYSVHQQPGGQLMYVSRIGNYAAAYSPHSGFTVFGMMDGGEFRVASGSKGGRHYSSQKTAETAIRKWIGSETRSGANRAGGGSRIIYGEEKDILHYRVNVANWLIEQYRVPKETAFLLVEEVSDSLISSAIRNGTGFAVFAKRLYLEWKDRGVSASDLQRAKRRKAIVKELSTKYKLSKRLSEILVENDKDFYVDRSDLFSVAEAAKRLYEFWQKNDMEDWNLRTRKEAGLIPFRSGTFANQTKGKRRKRNRCGCGG